MNAGLNFNRLGAVAAEITLDYYPFRNKRNRVPAIGTEADKYNITGKTADTEGTPYLIAEPFQSALQ